jgi:tetratricopeptide (TPR) repeat protein
MIQIHRFNHFSIRWLLSFMFIWGIIGGISISNSWVPGKWVSPAWAQAKKKGTSSSRATASGGSGANYPYQELWNEADQLQKTGDYAGAVKALEQAQNVLKGSYFYTALNHAKLGMAYYLWGRYDEAIKHSDEAVNLFRDRAQREVKGIVDVTPNLRACLLCKARALERKGKLEKAIAEHEAIAKTGKDQNAEINRLKQTIAYRKESAEKRELTLQKANEAEQQGQYKEAFQHYMTALNTGDSFQFATIEKIIPLYQKLDSPPPISEEARKHAAFASFAVKEAKDNKGYDKAISEYISAIRLAPWWSDPYLNTALLFEQLGDHQSAYAFLKTYFIAAPNAPDGEKLKTKLYELEFKAEQGKK